MALNRKKGMKEFLTERNKGISESPPLPAPPPLPFPPPTVSLLPIPNLKKKRKENKITEKGKVVPQKKPEQQKMAKNKGRASSMKSKEAEHSTKRAPSNLESPVGVGWCGGTLKLLHQGVPERPCPLHGRGSKASSPATQGHGCLEAHKAAQPLLVPKKGSSPGKFLGMLR